MKFWSKSTYVAGLVLAAVTPIAGRLALRHDRGCCELDGVAIEAAHRVRIVDADGSSHYFCRIGCAEAWLARQEAPAAAAYVTDEITGREAAPQMMYYVRSAVGAPRGASHRIHVFGDPYAAARHARDAHGRLLEGSERPLQDVGRPAVSLPSPP